MYVLSYTLLLFLKCLGLIPLKIINFKSGITNFNVSYVCMAYSCFIAISVLSFLVTNVVYFFEFISADLEHAGSQLWYFLRIYKIIYSLSVFVEATFTVFEVIIKANRISKLFQQIENNNIKLGIYKEKKNHQHFCHIAIISSLILFIIDYFASLSVYSSSQSFTLYLQFYFSLFISIGFTLQTMTIVLKINVGFQMVNEKVVKILVREIDKDINWDREFSVIEFSGKSRVMFYCIF